MTTLLSQTAYKWLLELATDEGINASGKDEIYGCIFGRDSAITILKILRVLEKHKDNSPFDLIELQNICRRSLLTLITLQGKEYNLESGEEPGKFIHEYRKEKKQYEHLINSATPWYVYPDGKMRIYDSIDATPLTLIAIYRYWKLTGDDAFLLEVLSSVERGLNWIITDGDKDKDNLLEYELPKTRKHGGLRVQSWTDSHESLQKIDGSMPEYPIAPVEVQGYAWLALKLWADFYRDEGRTFSRTSGFANKLSKYAKAMKKRFNELFLFEEEQGVFAAQALDGYKNQIRTVTGNPLLLLWAAYPKNNTVYSILEKGYVQDLVDRAFSQDLFDPDFGIRTMSIYAATFNSGQNSYHNGSFWPKLNGMIHEGLEHFGFEQEAEKLKAAALKPIEHFGTPIELYVKGENGDYLEFKSETGQVSCKNQAWSAAVTLDLLTS